MPKNDPRARPWTGRSLAGAEHHARLRDRTAKLASAPTHDRVSTLARSLMDGALNDGKEGAGAPLKIAAEDFWLAEAEAVLSRLIVGWRPTGAELTGGPIIDNWFVVKAQSGTRRLVGKVTCHPDPRVGRGPLTLTSRLLWVAEDLAWARTASRYYMLGRPRTPFVARRAQTERADIALSTAEWLRRERARLEG
jgi:hypothetical protein